LPKGIAALRAEELKELRYLVKFNKMTSGERVQMF